MNHWVAGNQGKKISGSAFSRGHYVNLQVIHLFFYFLEKRNIIAIADNRKPEIVANLITQVSSSWPDRVVPNIINECHFSFPVLEKKYYLRQHCILSIHVQMQKLRENLLDLAMCAHITNHPTCISSFKMVNMVALSSCMSYQIKVQDLCYSPLIHNFHSPLQ